MRLRLTLRILASLTAFGVTLSLLAFSAASRVYSGGIQQNAVLEAPTRNANASDTISGIVVARESGAPVRGAVVSVPALNRSTVSGADGRFSLSGLPQGQRFILNIAKTGFSPESLTLQSGINAKGPLRATLSASSGVLALDNVWRHLGDNRYSTRSAGASAFRLDAGGPAIRLPFSTAGVTLSRAPILRIGAVLGLDTEAAHAAGQSRLRISSSPAQILLNGRVIGELALNGSGQSFQTPPGLIIPNGMNLLEIRSGYQLPLSDPIDFDDFEFMTLTLSL
ncbi:MAG: carboxypeptidase regulatory-like domain-containing protein [Vampirovibrionales bacterium]|nr:carboxypeptidase regulatory-like domain-containing protein [Vampirovibrionales bacterium]